MGSVRNFETCINRTKGHIVHILHGDDFVLPGFYSELEQIFELYPNAGAAFSDFYYVNEKCVILYTDERITDVKGEIKNALEYLAEKQRIQPPAMVVKRCVYENLGSFYAVKYGEDWEMWVKIAAHYPILHVPEYLANYRIHTNNISTVSLITGQNIKDINKVISIIQTYLPVNKRKELYKKAKRNFGIYYAWMAHKVYHDYKHKQGALKQINGALKMSFNRTSLYLALKLYIKLLIRY